MAEETKEAMISKGVRAKNMLQAQRPSYFIQTKEGAYSGMIKHNLLGPTQSSIGSSLSFSDLAKSTSKLAKYSEQTGKSALNYYNLISGKELSGQENAESKLSLMVPYPSQYKAGKQMLISGYQANHTDYLISNKHKVT